MARIAGTDRSVLQADIIVEIRKHWQARVDHFDRAGLVGHHPAIYWLQRLDRGEPVTVPGFCLPRLDEIPRLSRVTVHPDGRLVEA